MKRWIPVCLGLLLAASGCRKYPGFKKLEDVKREHYDILYCLGHDKKAQYIVNAYHELKDEAVFFSQWDSSLVTTCHSSQESVEIDFSKRTLIGIVFEYKGEVNGNTEVYETVYHNEKEKSYIVELKITENGDQHTTGQLWFSIPKASEVANYQFKEEYLK